MKLDSLKFKDSLGCIVNSKPVLSSKTLHPKKKKEKKNVEKEEVKTVTAVSFLEFYLCSSG